MISGKSPLSAEFSSDSINLWLADRTLADQRDSQFSSFLDYKCMNMDKMGSWSLEALKIFQPLCMTTSCTIKIQRGTPQPFLTWTTAGDIPMADEDLEACRVQRSLHAGTPRSNPRFLRTPFSHPGWSGMSFMNPISKSHETTHSVHTDCQDSVLLRRYRCYKASRISSDPMMGCGKAVQARNDSS